MKLRIEKPVYGGACLARDEGKAIFVPFTLPGESVEAGVARDHGTYAEGELQTVLEPSASRTSPPCPYFGECGGCHYQHASYQAQTEMKTQILRETLERARIAEIPEIETLCGEPLGYRNRIRLQIDPATSKLCYKKRASNENLAVDICPIAAPVLREALKAIQAAAHEWKLGQKFSEIELFTNGAQDEMLISLWSTAREEAVVDALRSLWAEMKKAVPQAKGAAAFTSERRRQEVKGVAQAGEPFLTYVAAGRDYRASTGSFFQVNRFLLEPLVKLVAGGHKGGLAWDLYAGVGLFSAALAESFDRVVAVESAPSAVRDLRRNIQGKEHRVIAASTMEFLRKASGGAAPEFIVVDPPRAGLGKEVAGLLAGSGAAHITYVSCDPATLSRDLKWLLDSGYHLKAMRMVDLFPQTFHLEGVAELSLK